MNRKLRYIIGLGNYARNDDGIGLRIVEKIVEQDLDKDFEAVEIGNDGMRLLTYFTDRTDSILLVDCALMDRKPGEHLLFSYDDIRTEKKVGNISTHEGDIVKLVELAKSLEYPVPEIRILAVEPESLEMDMTLSECLESRLPEYVDAAIAAVNDFGG